MSKKTAIVIGVGPDRGLGAQLCHRFAADGLHVLVAGRSKDKLDAVVAAITQSGGSAESVQADATSEADTIALFDAAGNSLDLAIYNAGNKPRVESPTWKLTTSSRVGACAASAAFSLHAKPLAAWPRSEGGRCFSREPALPCEAAPTLVRSIHQRARCGTWRKPWRRNTGKTVYMSDTWS